MKKITILFLSALLISAVVHAAEVASTKTTIKTTPSDPMDVIDPEEYEVYRAVFADGKRAGIPSGHGILPDRILFRKETVREI